jgi:hypothetical protein
MNSAQFGRFGGHTVPELRVAYEGIPPFDKWFSFPDETLLLHSQEMPFEGLGNLAIVELEVPLTQQEALAQLADQIKASGFTPRLVVGSGNGNVPDWRFSYEGKTVMAGAMRAADGTTRVLLTLVPVDV